MGRFTFKSAMKVGDRVRECAFGPVNGKPRGIGRIQALDGEKKTYKVVFFNSNELGLNGEYHLISRRMTGENPKYQIVPV